MSGNTKNAEKLPLPKKNLPQGHALVSENVLLDFLSLRCPCKMVMSDRGGERIPAFNQSHPSIYLLSVIQSAQNLHLKSGLCKLSMISSSSHAYFNHI